jgi:hypothetical protein
MAASTRAPGPKPVPLTRLYRREYAIWAGMKQRCTNPKCKEYRYYGERGIRVCGRWSATGGFGNFLKDLGPQPFARASVHRLDNDRGYTPANTVWADAQTQARHMRTNRIIPYEGERKILVEWAEQLGIKPGTLSARLAKGWSVERAFNTPVAPRRPFSPWVGRRR